MVDEPRAAPSAPVLAPGGTSPAEASRPETPLDEQYHIYESNPAPWWIALLWMGFFIFGVTYLILNLLR